MPLTLSGSGGITYPDGTVNTTRAASTAGDTFTGQVVLKNSALDLQSGQIKFPATQSASSDANTLDDYEEGTWTPQMYFGNTLATASGASGFYVKVGKTVTVTANYKLSGKNGGTGQCALRNFPFPNIATGDASRGGAAMGYFNGFSSLNPYLMLESGSSTIAVFRRGNDIDFNDTTVANGSTVWFSYTYITNA